MCDVRRTNLYTVFRIQLIISCALSLLFNRELLVNKSLFCISKAVFWYLATTTLPSVSFASEIEHIIVTGVHTPQKMGNTTASVEVIGRKDLEILNKSVLTDVLRTIPGVLVNQQGGIGGNIDVSIRGSESNFVAVYIDGLQVNDPTSVRGGSFNFNSININNIERIEIVKGPQSAVYGSDSLAGVIQIITRRPTESMKHTIFAEVSEHKYYRLGYGMSGTLGMTGYSFDVAQLDSGSGLKDSAYKSDEANAKLALIGLESTRLQLSLRHLDDSRTNHPEQSGGPEFAALEQLEKGDATEWGSTLSWEQQISSLWQSQLQTSYFRRESEIHSPGIFPFSNVPPNFEKTKYEHTSWSWINKLGMTGKFWANLGVDGKKENGKSRGEIDFGFVVPTGFKLERENIGSFVNVNWKFIQGWLLQVSIRHDNPDKGDSEVTRQLGIKTPVYWKRFTASANWGEGYKLPGFSALAHSLVGNPDLKPETSESWDVAVKLAFGDMSTLALTYFENNYQDLVDFDAEQFKNVNRSNVETSGAELSWHWLPIAALTVYSYGTYTDIDVIDSVSMLTGRPQLVLGSIVNWGIKDNLDLGLDYRWTDTRFASSLHTGVVETSELSSYKTTELKLSWKLNEEITLKFAIDNVANEEYSEAVGFPARGRMFRAAVKLTL